jgi:hypothetical protein
MSTNTFEINEEEFDLRFEKFIDFCSKVLTKNHGINTGVNPIVPKMNKFVKIIEKLDYEEKKGIFISCLFEPHKRHIMSKDFDHSWMDDAKIELIIPNIKNPKDRMVMCSTIYKKCVKLKIDVEKSLEGLLNATIDDKEELNYPDIFCLHYYRMLYQIITTTKEANKVKEKLKNIESELGITENKEVNITANPMASINGLMNGTGGNMGQQIGNLISGLTPALSNMVKQNPDGTSKLDFQGLKDVFKPMMQTIGQNNPEMAKKIGENFGGILDSSDPQEMIGKAVKKIGQMDLNKMITDHLGPLNNNSDSKAVSDSAITALQIGSSSSLADASNQE